MFTTQDIIKNIQKEVELTEVKKPAQSFAQRSYAADEVNDPKGLLNLAPLRNTTRLLHFKQSLRGKATLALLAEHRQKLEEKQQEAAQAFWEKKKNAQRKLQEILAQKEQAKHFFSTPKVIHAPKPRRPTRGIQL